MTKQAVEKGGTEEYIKKGAKSRVDKKRSFDDRKITKKITITADTDFLLDSLALIYGISRGELLDEIIHVTAVAYNLAIEITAERPDFGELKIYKVQ